MTIPSFTILVQSDSSFEVIASSSDAQTCLDAWKECDDVGTVIFFRKGKQQRIKRNVAKPGEVQIKKRGRKKADSAE